MQAGLPFADLVGRSEAIEALRVKLARLVAASGRRLPAVLIQGETGAGKGLLARALHGASARAGGPFVDLNCAAVPASLLETELFGHAEGAFTDARHARPGLVQAANGGTLFLDEIGALAPDLQAKLLKAIEEQVVRRIGATRAEPVDVWVISATNEDLAAAVAGRRFRADLYHRLAGVEVTLPPLRDRGDDVLVLAEYFLEAAARTHGLPRLLLAPDARQALLAHDWPGNVRELANLLERTALLEPGPLITATMLGLSSPATAPSEERLPAGGSVTDHAQISAALEATAWNVSQAADRLGISRNTLRYRMSQLGLVGARAPRRRPKGFRWQGPGQPALERRVAVLGVRLGLSDETNERIVRTITAFGGRLEGIIEDCAVAVFGLQSDEDAPRRAAEAALRMLTESPGCRAAALDVMTIPVASRGVLSRDERARALATVRPLLEPAADGSVVVGSVAAAILERHFRMDPLAGPGAPSAFRLVSRITPDSASRPRPPTPFVGRDDDLTLLEGAVDDARAGRGQFVGIVGEPGAGKSRLLHELRGRVAGRGRWVALACVSHARGVPYYPVVELLRQQWALDAARAPAVAIATVREQMGLHGVDVESATACVLRLLGVPGHDDVLVGLAPEAVGRMTADALRALLLAGDGPLVVAVEDLHWADPSTQELLGTLVDVAPRSPLLIVATYRPGYRPPWIDRSSTTQLALAPLAPHASAQLVRAVLEPDLPTASTVDSLVNRAQGNPLFLEELAWAVRQGARPDTGAVPESLEDALAARLGRLSPVARRLLSIIAVLGPEVPLRLVQEVAGERETPGLLAELTQLELLRSDVAAPLYSFRHVVLQEVCYARLPDDERRRLHAAAAAALERLWRGREDEVLDRLARHHAGAGHPAPAIASLTRLAARATMAYGLNEAVELLEQALGLTRTLPDTRARDHETVRIVQALARPLILLGRLEECRDLLAGHRETAQRAGDALSCAHDVWLAMAHDHLGDPVTAVKYASEALQVALAGDQTTTAGRARMLLAFASFWAGDLGHCVELAAQAAEALNDPEEAVWRGMAVYVGALGQSLLGDFDTALSTAETLRGIAERAADRRLESYAHHLRGWIAGMRGDAATAVAACARAVEIAPDPLAVGVTLYYLGEARLVGADDRAATQDLERVLELNRRFRFAPLECLTLGGLAEAQLRSGDVAVAEKTAGEALALSERIPFAWGRGRAHRALGRVARAAGDHERAARHLSESLDTFTRLSAQWEIETTARCMVDLPVSA